MDTSIRVFAILLLVSIFGLQNITLADGPHWWIPEPPSIENEHYVIEGEPAEMFKIRQAMAGKHKAQKMVMPANAVAKRDDDLLKSFTLLCIRYCREMETYVAAPDSPDEWKSDAGREKMLKNAHAYMRILGTSDATYAKLIVDGWVDTVRFDDALEQHVNDPNVVAHNKALANLQTAFNAWTEGGMNAADKTVWKGPAAEYYKALTKLRQFMPETFKQNITGDIPAQQPAAEDNLREGVFLMGFHAIPHLQLVANHRSKKVREVSAFLYSRINNEIGVPSEEGLNWERLLFWVKKLTALKTPEQIYAAMSIKRHGDAAIPMLLEIGKSDKVNLKTEVGNALYAFTGKNFKTDMANWEGYLKARIEIQKNKEAALQAKK